VSPPDKPTENCNWWCRNNEKGQLENEHREEKIRKTWRLIIKHGTASAAEEFAYS
jgi:hypothetical protein